MYIYLISTGAYSSYTVDCLAVHEKFFRQKELEAMVDEVKQSYVAKKLSVKDYEVKEEEVEKIFMKILRERGFKILYPAGEFHHNDYSCFDDISAHQNKREGNALALGLG